MKLYQQVFGVLLGLSVSGLTFAEGSDESTSDLWLLAKYDTNGDQVISVSEIEYKRDKMFSYMDDDADGIVSFAEYQGLDVRKRELLLKARYQKLDLDHDGELSAEEYRSYLGSFDRFDTDGDGNITAAEMHAPQESVQVKAKESSPRCLLWICVRTTLE